MVENLIVSDPKVMMGKPVITGTRITVASILEKFAAGETSDQILNAHPRLTAEAIRQAFQATVGLWSSRQQAFRLLYLP